MYEFNNKFFAKSLSFRQNNSNSSHSVDDMITLPFYNLFFYFPFLNKEVMKQQQKLTNLLKFLAAIPNSDEHINFVLQLAEQSVTIETLQNLIKNNAATQSDVKKQGLDVISEL